MKDSTVSRRARPQVRPPPAGDLLAKQPGVSYQHRMITVEPVLPQNPKGSNVRKQDFTDEERLHGSHRLGNLVLLNRAKNGEAQNYDFAKKTANYFTSANGSAVFALTTQVLSRGEWTPAVIEARQAGLLAVLHKEWELN
ncbi:HNH endonuclease family protein [Nocardia sp. NPDC058705]|uniref:HNH endonuclease family protein n=1 Tax=Nocardia sp. NPDC058705 TaxID=3346609 RepID=UPI00369513E8